MVQGNPVARLSELISGINVAILTTVRPDNSLHSCPMMSQGVDDHGAFWFVSGGNSEKIEAVRTIQRVSLCFADHASQRYVSVSGYCELVRNHEIAKQLWKPEYKSWFPGGVEGSDLVLMKIVVQQAEYWDAAQNRMTPLRGFEEVAVL